MARGRGFEFCCCAIPLINVGAYAVVLEVALVALILGALSLAPHSITAGEGVIPSYAQGIVAALAFITFLWQFVGILAIRRETTKLYHTYVRISTILTIAIIAVTIVFAILAAVHHSTAAATCVRNYGAMPSTTATGFSTSSLTQNYGPQICNYFLWAQTGVMFGLIVFLGLIQLYMCFASRAYGVAQRAAARDFKHGFRAPDDEIPLSSRNMPGAYNSTLASPTWDDTTAQKHFHPTGPSGESWDSNSHAVPHSYDTAAAAPTHGHVGETGWSTNAGNTTGYPAYAGGAAPGQAAQHGAYPAYPAYEGRAL